MPPPQPPTNLIRTVAGYSASFEVRGAGHFPRAPLLHWGGGRTWEKGDGMVFFLLFQDMAAHGCERKTTLLEAARAAATLAGASHAGCQSF